MKILFLDFDGVIRVPVDWETADGHDYCPDLLRRIAWIVRSTGAMLVTCSERRWMDGRDKIMAELEPWLPEAVFHADWQTPREPRERWAQIEAWLARHPEVTRYAILDDEPMHYDGAPADMTERLVVCADEGITPQIMPVVSCLLNGR